jgi:hypothetical protein
MMFGWFKRSPAKPRLKLPPQPPAARDWEVGDVAKCVVQSWGVWTNEAGERHEGPREGQLFRVIAIRPDDDTIFLCFAPWPNCGFAAGNFKKLRACSADFHEQIRKPAPVPKVKAIPELVP